MAKKREVNPRDQWGLSSQSSRGWVQETVARISYTAS